MYFFHLSKKSLIEKIKLISEYEKKNIIVPERFVNVVDLFEIIKNFLKVFPIFFKMLNYKHFEIKYFIYIELEKYLKSPDLNFQIWSYLPVLKKLSKICKINKAFDHYENMISEHVMIFALKKYFKNTKIYGYHHTFSSKQFLCWRHLIQEWESNFKPDYVISSYLLSESFLISQNCPRDRIILGPALRYKNLFDQKDNNLIVNTSSIAVPLSQIKDHSLEIIEKVFEVHKCNKNMHFYICPHPNLDLDNKIVKKFFRDNESFKLSKYTLRETILKSKFVISSATGAVYDSIILNKIIFNLKSDLNFCDNYTDFLIDKFNFLTSLNTQEISKKLEKCSEDTAYLHELSKQYDDVSKYFIKKLQYDKDFFEITN